MSCLFIVLYTSDLYVLKQLSNMLTTLRKYIHVPFHTKPSFLCIHKEFLFSRGHRKFPPLALGSACFSQNQTLLMGLTSQIPHLSTDVNSSGRVKNKGKSFTNSSLGPCPLGKTYPAPPASCSPRSVGKASSLLNKRLQGGDQWQHRRSLIKSTQ